MNNSTSLGLALVRIVLGVIMLAHGIQKFLVFTVSGVQGMLSDLGFPLASVFGVLLPVAEVAAGALLILGLFTRIAGGVSALVGLGATFLAHGAAGFFVSDGGYEFVLLIAAAGAGLAFTGGGRFALDAVLPFGRKAPAEQPAAH